MLPKRHTTLQSEAAEVDESCVSGPPSPESDPRLPAPTSDDASALSMRQLAHELNSLLDGSMRCLGLARRSLSVDENHNIEDALDRLQAAQQSLHHMADLLQRAMTSDTPDHRLLSRDQPLGVQVQELLDLLRPKARELRVELSADVSPAAADLPAGPLVAVLLNGLNNAIEACAASDRRAGVVECSISVTAKRELLIVIADTGRGIESDFKPGMTTKAGGHGIGVPLCRQIVAELGGTLRLSNVPYGGGTVMQVMIPEARLRAA